MEFGVNRVCNYMDVSISATLPYYSMEEQDSRLRELLLAGGTGMLQSGANEEITTDKIGFAKIAKSYVAIYPDEV